MPDIDFFSSPIGLGHATRDAAIAKYFDDISSKFVTGNGAAKILLDLGFKVDDVYIPPQFNVKGGVLQHSAKWLWKYYQYYKNCKNISNDIIERDNPKLVISDEDFASLSVAQSKKIPSVLITDILETRFTGGFSSWIEKKMNKSMCGIIQKCDKVIIPEHGNDEKNIVRVGPIVRETKHTREELRRKFSFNKKTILISVGGTNAGLFLIEETLKALSRLNLGLDIVVVSGPSINQNFKQGKNLGFVDNLHELIFASDVLVALAGKSTIDEANAYGTPSIFIPIKGHFEQEDNARNEGFSFDDIHRIDKLIKEKIDEPRRDVSFTGTTKAVDVIKTILGQL